MTPENLKPRISATPRRRPIVASNPRILNLKGCRGSPRRVAAMLFASTLASRMACCAVGGWNLPGFRTSGTSAIAQCPNAGTVGHLEEFVCENAAPLLGARQIRHQLRRRDARRPDQHARGDLRPIIQSHFLSVVGGDFRLRADFHSPPNELFLAYRPRLALSSGRITSPGSTTTTRTEAFFRLG